MTTHSYISEFYETTSDFTSELPNYKQSDLYEYPYTETDVDTFIDSVMNTSDTIDQNDRLNLSKIYSNMRDSRFLDNYLYLFFKPTTQFTGITATFLNTLRRVLYDSCATKNQRIEFLDNLEKRIKRIEYLRGYSHDEEADNDRYVDTRLLFEAMLMYMRIYMKYAVADLGLDCDINENGDVIQRENSDYSAWDDLEEIA